MQCTKYPERPAAGVCAYSGKPFSAEELVEVEGRMYARDNLTMVFAAAKASSAAPVPQAMPTIVVNNSSSSSAAASAVASVGGGHVYVRRRSKTVALVLALCMFLGLGGLHRFYTGHTVAGAVQLLTFGGFLIWGTLDIVMIVTGSYRDAQGNLLA